MNIFYYLLEANLYILVFYAFYKLFLEKETFYSFNRFYLLVTTTLAFTMPAISLSALYAPVQIVVNSNQEAQTASAAWNGSELIIVIYAAVCIGLLARLILSLCSIMELISRGNTTHVDGLKVVEIGSKKEAFSFLSYLFINSNAPGTDLIIRHEQVHIRQLHSLDILFFELVRIINWFNPFIQFIIGDLKAIHEFIADEKAASSQVSISEYAMFLIKNSYGVEPEKLANNMFNQSLLKRRIMKLNQQRSHGSARLKYLLTLILIPTMLCGTAMSFSKSYGIIDLMPGKVIFQDTLKKKRVPPPPPAPPAPPIPPKVSSKTPPPPPAPPEPPKVSKSSKSSNGVAPPPPPRVKVSRKPGDGIAPPPPPQAPADASPADKRVTPASGAEKPESADTPVKISNDEFIDLSAPVGKSQTQVKSTQRIEPAISPSAARRSSEKKNEKADMATFKSEQRIRSL